MTDRDKRQKDDDGLESKEKQEGINPTANIDVHDLVERGYMQDFGLGYPEWT